MYTSYIGKKFLQLYNQKEQKSYSARTFFDEVFFPIFFDDEKHLMHVGNSPFFQKPSAKAMEGGLTKAQAQLKKLHQDIQSEAPNMAIFVGYAAKDMNGTTSGQLSNIDFKIDAEEMYASWIGEALGIGVSGGFVMLLDKEEVLWALFEGWKVYRKFLFQTPELKDRQIETWNGNWLVHAFSKDYNPEEPTENFIFEPESVLGKLAITTQSWSKVLFTLTKKYPKAVVTAYAYNLSQTNTTLGFVNLYLPEVNRMHEWRDKVFFEKKENIIKEKEIDQLETYYNFKGACKLGTIGLKALEPDKLRDFMPLPYGRGKDYKFSDVSSYTLFQIYKIWIIAMLNKTELLNLATKTAGALCQYEQKSQEGGRGTTKHSQLTEEIRNAPSLVKFLDKLNDLLNKYGDNNLPLNREDIKEVINLPSDRFPLFQTLIKLEYTFISKQKTQN